MVEGKVFIVGLRESTARGIWDSCTRTDSGGSKGGAES